MENCAGLDLKQSLLNVHSKDYSCSNSKVYGFDARLDCTQSTARGIERRRHFFAWSPV